MAIRLSFLIKNFFRKIILSCLRSNVFPYKSLYSLILSLGHLCLECAEKEAPVPSRLIRTKNETTN